jgi:hypothetical protein
VGCGKEFDAAGQLAGATADVAACPASVTATASTPLPSDLPTLPGTWAYQSSSQGATRVWFTTVPGRSDTIVSTRDRLVAAFRQHGYELTSSDQEPGAEADAAFAGRHPGTIQVRPLCRGHLRVRYVVNS